MTCWMRANRSGGNSVTGATCCRPALLTRMSTSAGSASIAAWVGQIGDVRLAADPGGDRLGRLGVPVDHVHRGARRRQRHGARLADTAAAAGDQGGPGRQVHAGTRGRRAGGGWTEFACHGRKQ
ncbi:hypothetical protein SHIRM173S_00431 [Streptomyces hirsutus]